MCSPRGCTCEVYIFIFLFFRQLHLRHKTHNFVCVCLSVTPFPLCSRSQLQHRKRCLHRGSCRTSRRDELLCIFSGLLDAVSADGQPLKRIARRVAAMWTPVVVLADDVQKHRGKHRSRTKQRWIGHARRYQHTRPAAAGRRACGPLDCSCLRAGCTHGQPMLSVARSPLETSLVF